MNAQVNVNNCVSNIDEACKTYVLNYEPLYIFNTDTFVVAKFNIVPDSLNIFLIQCAKERNFYFLKYAVAIIFKHDLEYTYQNHSDYILKDVLIQENNGFITLLREAMRDEYTNEEWESGAEVFPFVNNVFAWCWKNKQKIIDFDFCEKYYKKQEKKYKRLRINGRR
jgi:hypothetical protein